MIEITKKCEICGIAIKCKTSHSILHRRFCSTKCCKQFYKQEYEINKNKSDYYIFERDNFQCTYCGKTSYEDNAKLVIDHIYPRKFDGNNDLHNLTTSCIECNLSKSDKIMSEATLLKIWDNNHKKDNIRLNKIEYEKLKEAFDKKYPKRN